MMLLFQFNSYQGSVYFTTANTVAGKVYEWSSDLESFFSLTKNNEQLTQRNLYLERQVKVMSEQLEKYTRDSSFLKSNQLALLHDYRLITAKVITNSINKQDNYITINKGSADGIHRDMGVACGNEWRGRCCLYGESALQYCASGTTQSDQYQRDHCQARLFRLSAVAGRQFRTG